MPPIARHLLRATYPVTYPIFNAFHRLALTPWNRYRSREKSERLLEIGPGPTRLDGFETLNIIAGLHIDYVHDVRKPLPFQDGCFDLIYASHILEHVPWYLVGNVLAQWVRTLKSGGQLEIWTPDSQKIAKAFVEAEEHGNNGFEQDGWFRFNDEHDPCVWANGRIFSYGDSSGRRNHHNWHLALFSPRYLELLLRRSGLQDVRRLPNSAVRGHDHGWINLGYCGTRP